MNWLRGVQVLHVLVRFNGRTVDERFLRVGRPLRIGSDGDAEAHRSLDATVQVPVADGGPYVARVLWRGPTCMVQDAKGTVREVGPTELVSFTDGDLVITLRRARRLALPALDWPSVGAGLAWAVVVLLSTVFSIQFGWAAENLCTAALLVLPGVMDVGGPLLWLVLPALSVAVAVVSLVVANSWRSVVPALLAPVFGVLIPLGWSLSGAQWRTGNDVLGHELYVCLPPEPSSGSAGSNYSAEYLARLLRKDYAGEEQGVIEDKIDRPEAERDAQNDDGRHFYMPAGSAGPATKMGGASERSLRPVRTVVVESEPTIPRKRKAADQPQAVDGDTPIPSAPEPEQGPDDVAADGADEEEPDEGAEPPSEEVEGWGIPGWYDEQDRAAEKLEIDIVLRMAKRRLAIDPDDLGALGVMSYYQYLAQDYSSALRTYDKMLAIDPEDAAAYNNKALVYKRMEDYRKEEGLYRQSLNLEPNDTTALNNLAVNLAHQGRYDEALAIMRELERSDPDDPYADLHRSKIYAQMGRDDDAFRYLEVALQGMRALDTLHHIEFRQDIRIDPAFEKLRGTARFKTILTKYYGKDTPLEEGR
jgi:tetratricopeptide (TPR) repeat protein